MNDQTTADQAPISEEEAARRKMIDGLVANAFGQVNALNQKLASEGIPIDVAILVMSLSIGDLVASQTVHTGKDVRGALDFLNEVTSGMAQRVIRAVEHYAEAKAKTDAAAPPDAAANDEGQVAA